MEIQELDRLETQIETMQESKKIKVDIFMTVNSIYALSKLEEWRTGGKRRKES